MSWKGIDRYTLHITHQRNSPTFSCMHMRYQVTPHRSYMCPVATHERTSRHSPLMWVMTVTLEDEGTGLAHSQGVYTCRARTHTHTCTRTLAYSVHHPSLSHSAHINTLTTATNATTPIAWARAEHFFFSWSVSGNVISKSILMVWYGFILHDRFGMS